MVAYTDKQKEKFINTICERMAKGRSLRSVLKDNGMPCRQSFHNWVDERKERIDQYIRAREDRADTIFEDIFDIADSQEGDTITLEDGKEVTNHDAIQRARLRIDSRKWILSKMQPKKYGDKIDIDHTSKGESLNITVSSSKLKDKLEKE